MKLPRLRTILLAPLALFAMFYLAGVIVVSLDDETIAPLSGSPAIHDSIVIFGASGTAGDGILTRIDLIDFLAHNPGRGW